MIAEGKLGLEKRPASLSLNIRSRDHLARRLAVPLRVLNQLARHVVWHYNPTRLREKKGGGKPREINAPRPRLKKIQRRINGTLLAGLWLPDSIHAYRTGRSIKTAAEPHKGQRFLWVADIRHFYPSISHIDVYSMLTKLGCTPDVARLLTILTTYGHKLPQGAPTSPALANLYMRLSGVAARLGGLAARHRLNITCFGDDILISGDRSFKGLTRHFARIIQSCGLKLHETKTLPVAGPSERHKALGVVMNSFGRDVDVPRAYRRRLKSLIRVSQRYGPAALREFGITSTDPKAYLQGKIAFAVYINPRNRVFLESLKQIGL